MGFILLIGVMLFLIVATIMGVRSSRKMYKENHPNKNRPFALFFSIALLSGLVYVFGAKKMELSIDLTLSWMLFTMGLFFCSGIVFFSGFFMNRTEDKQAE
ncbi:hypothetical protein M3685_23340 [Heyndrickxia oleronia]|uniref:NADH dehydrogenase subunit 6 n=1 Tax=Heyndrickxia oleronia TaxID=38875 RepID=A0AAW6SU32_9BACI|nr:hypothetical protein [Heyndrickxia oleronia]NYV66668.1 hypothetical protein [Bacillus sp. Gen3]OJH17155.1 hypothetical protein BLX88_20005 [Bacillus obstructivus]MBU5211959.1 hypothetical protein [Heyndrickxia oleronia]MCM3239335.1 hypothetical protein [Heyndrickxia oleronia]MCM3456824.1 hypothetical protein [Heyndrickxia oleronia]